MTNQFKEVTKNNGLKQVEWGSEEFLTKIEQIEALKEEQEEKKRHYDAVAIIKGM